MADPIKNRTGAVVATGSTHYVQLDCPDLVIAAIQKVLEAGKPNSK